LEGEAEGRSFHPGDEPVKDMVRNAVTGEWLTYNQLFDELYHRTMNSMAHKFFHLHQRDTLMGAFGLPEFFDVEIEMDNNELLGLSDPSEWESVW